MRVAFLPVYPNPYQMLLGDALLGYGVNVAFIHELPPASWLTEQQGHIDLLHYHWLDGLYMKRFLTPIQVARFLRHLTLARKLGYRMVWTAHNILPHRVLIPQFHAALQRIVIRKLDAIITHCEYGRHELLTRFPTEKPVVVIPHGHYRDVYDMEISRLSAREKFNIAPSSFVYLALGNIAAYKGLDHLVESFRRCAGHSDVLVIAGRNRDKHLVSKIESVAAVDSRIRIFPGYIPDHEMQSYITAADVMVAPFTEILTSGSVIAGLSFDLPVIAPALGCLPELISPAAGILYPPDDPIGLDNALLEIKRRSLPTMRAEAHRIASVLNWNDIGRKTADVYEACLA